MKRGLTFFGIFCFLLFVSFSVPKGQIKKYTLTRIVIDAGHGGHDPGCIGKISKEKDIALDIALKFGNYIKTYLKDVEVIYTRSDDSFVELYRRAKLANELKADLFISIHCNANKKTEPFGVETYVMGVNKIDDNREIASKENASILMESDYKNQYEGFDPNKGFDPNSAEFMISYNIKQKAFLEQSLDIAARVQKHLCDNLHRFNRGVKQAGFLVLWRTTMPSILIETGFLSNKNEEDYMVTEEGKTSIAFAIYKAFKEYKCKMEGVECKDSEKAPVFEKRPKTTLADTNRAEVNPRQEAPKEVVKQVDSAKVTKQESPAENKVKQVKTEIRPDTTKAEVVFKVQFATSTEKKSPDSPMFKDMQDVDTYYRDGVYRYTVGREDNLASATYLQNKMRSKGYKDAFVIAFYKGERISMKEAQELIKK